MKKTMILSCFLCMTSLCSMAQLEVDSLGKVIIGVNDTLTANSKLNIGGAGVIGTEMSIQTNNTDGINVLTSSNKAGLLVRLSNNPTVWSGNITGVKVQPESDLLSNTEYGVHVWHGCTYNHSYGVCSQYLNVTGPHAQGTASIYGSINVYTPSLQFGQYAGYFDGDVKVAGGGTLYATLLTPSGTSSMMNRSGTSDVLAEEDELVSSKLSNIGLVRLYREPEQQNKELAEGVVLPEGMELEDVKPQTQLAAVQYGLAADQLREVFPELVYEDQNGNVSINYIEMIPLMLQYINELKAEVDELKGGGGDVVTKEVTQKNKTIATTDDDTLLLSLGQNNPNPFSEQTSIEVSIPENVSVASLLIFDMQGKQVKKIDIDERGIFRITVTGQGLNEGMYLYSLIADGKVVQTRKMILSK